MNLQRCKDGGHFYDADHFDSCPYCNQTSVSTVLQDENGNPEYTMPNGVVDQGGGLKELEDQINNSKIDEEDGQSTIGYFGDVKTEPVVGWLVSVTGSNYGQDFRLKTGKNFIGRSTQMDVSLTEDSSISRDRHAIILYEPKGNIFIVQPGDAKELFYLNDKVVLTATEIFAYDVISLGKTKLLFIPCCSKEFTWDMVKQEEEKK